MARVFKFLGWLIAGLVATYFSAFVLILAGFAIVAAPPWVAWCVLLGLPVLAPLLAWLVIRRRLPTKVSPAAPSPGRVRQPSIRRV